MKVIKAFTEILKDRDNIYLDIEERGRICYKSEDKITDESAPKFIKFAKEKRHQTVLEMRSITLEVKIKNNFIGLNELRAMSPWIRVDIIDFSNVHNNDIYLVTGSPRAFREACESNKANAQYLMDKLKTKYPLLFEDITDNGLFLKDLWEVKVVNVDDYKDTPVYKHHKHMCVKFTVNRAVSHELVRHRQHILQESQRYCRYADEVVFIAPHAFWQEGSEDQEMSDEWAIWLQTCYDSEKAYLQLLKTSTPQAARTVLINSCKTEVLMDMSLSRWNHFLFLRTSTGAEPSMREVAIPLLEDVKKLYPEYFSNLKASLVGE